MPGHHGFSLGTSASRPATIEGTCGCMWGMTQRVAPASSCACAMVTDCAGNRDASCGCSSQLGDVARSSIRPDRVVTAADRSAVIITMNLLNDSTPTCVVPVWTSPSFTSGARLGGVTQATYVV